MNNKLEDLKELLKTKGGGFLNKTLEFLKNFYNTNL